MNKKLGLFTEAEIAETEVMFKEEVDNAVAGDGLAYAASAPFFAGGAATAAGGFALAGV